MPNKTTRCQYCCVRCRVPILHSLLPRFKITSIVVSWCLLKCLTLLCLVQLVITARDANHSLCDNAVHSNVNAHWTHWNTSQHAIVGGYSSALTDCTIWFLIQTYGHMQMQISVDLLLQFVNIAFRQHGWHLQIEHFINSNAWCCFCCTF